MNSLQVFWNNTVIILIMPKTKREKEGGEWGGERGREKRKRQMKVKNERGEKEKGKEKVTENEK